MNIAIGSDHGGFKLKEQLIYFLKREGHNVKDFGTYSEARCDYPIIGYKVANAIKERRYHRGILICKTGIGMSIVANRVKGVRAGLCDRIDIARLSREHNDTNVLVFSANIVSKNLAKRLLKVWLATRALGERHKKRVREIDSLETTEDTEINDK
jgi:ribose 5-phosphate isomerase B